MKYTEEQRKQIEKECAGKVVRSLEWVPAGLGFPAYWVMEFEDDTELSFQMMAEIVP